MSLGRMITPIGGGFICLDGSVAALCSNLPCDVDYPYIDILLI